MYKLNTRAEPPVEAEVLIKLRWWVQLPPARQMNCCQCNTFFIPKFSNSKYCSKACYNYCKRARHIEKNKKERVCEFCNSKFLSFNKAIFCSAACVSRGTINKRKKFITIPDCLESSSRKLDKTLGYVRIYAPMHKEANTWGYVYEHRIIAEFILNRNLLEEEIVHHKNGKRWDNRPENLEVMNKIDHAKLHGQRDEDLDI